MKYYQPFKKRALALAVSSATVLAGGISAQALAQEEELQEIEETIVTGSRIKRVDLSSVTPVSVVTGEEFKISGNINIEQKLAQLPQTVPAGVVDLNTVPASLIKQVDITTGGASAVYGSDALSGVVNFQLVDDYEGAEFSALYDVTSDNDGGKFNFDFTLGGNFDEGRGNAVIFGSYSERDPVFQGDRSFSNVALTENGGQLVPGGSSGVPGTRVFGGPNLANGDNVGIFNADGSARAFLDPEDRFNYAPDNFLQLPQERFLTSAMIHYDLTESVRVYSELTIFRS